MLSIELLPIVDAFAAVVERQGKLALRNLELSLALSAEGSIGFVTIGAQAPHTLSFAPSGS